MSDKIKIDNITFLHEKLQTMGSKLARASELTLDRDINRALDQTARGTYRLFMNGVPITKDDVRKILSTEVFNDPNLSLEKKLIFAIAEDELEKYPELKALYEALPADQKEKVTTKFANGLTSDLTKIFESSATTGKSLKSEYSVQKEKLSIPLSSGIERVFAFSYDGDINGINKEQTFIELAIAQYLNLEENVKSNFARGIKVAIDISSAAKDSLIVGTIFYKSGLANSKEDNYGFFVKDITQYDHEEIEFTGQSYKGQAGHFKAVSTQIVEGQYLNYEDLLNSNNIPGSGIQLSSQFLQEARPLLEEAKRALDKLRAVDKMFFTVSGGDSTAAEIKSLIPKAINLGITEIMIIEKTSPTSAPSDTVLQTNIEYSARVYSPYEQKRTNVGIKAGLQKEFKNEVIGTLEKIARLYLEYQIGKPRSSSLFTEAVIRAVKDSLKPLIGKEGEKDLLNALKKRGVQTKILQTLSIPKGKTVDIGQMKGMLERERSRVEQNIRSAVKAEAALRDKNNKKRRQNRKKYSEMRSANASLKLNYGSIVSSMNTELRDMIISDMVRPRLVNRTGRLAGSAQIINGSFDKIEFTYRKNPYSVFSNRDGRSPWATRNRDPEALIRRSIKRLAEGKYKSAFRPNVYIKGV